jgi:hypothetical protein
VLNFGIAHEFFHYAEKLTLGVGWSGPVSNHPLLDSVSTVLRRAMCERQKSV